MTTRPLSSIIIDRDDRQRRELTDIESLAASIATNGLINPIVVNENNQLIAGERRYTACLALGWDSIPVTIFENLSPIQQHLIELEENIKRVDLAWQDEARAIEKYHKLLQSLNPDHTLVATAQALATSERNITRRLLVARYLDIPEVAEQKELSTAYNFAMRKEERKKADTSRSMKRNISDIISDVAPASSATPAAPPPPPLPPASIINEDFNRWTQTYTGEPFNLIHCDFPYGENTGDKVGQSAAKYMGTYDDSRETYDKLLDTLCAGGGWLSHSAHLIFWLSFARYFDTAELLSKSGWRVNQRPLIWHKTDGAGIIPDPNRGPRWVGEYAIFASKGDRKIVRAVPNIIGAKTTRDYHTSEKPRQVLEHFFRMVVDDNTRCLDPTCGGGNAVRVASELGASSALGLELNPQFTLTAQENLSARSSL